MQAAVMEVISLASGKPLYPPSSHQIPVKDALITKQSKGGTPQHRPHSMSSTGRPHSMSSTGAPGLSRHGTSSGTTRTTTASNYPTRPLTESEDKVLSHFCELVFDTVGKMVVRSQQQLSGGLQLSRGEEQEEVETGEALSAGEEGGRSKGILKNATTMDPQLAVNYSDRKTVSFNNQLATEIDYDANERGNTKKTVLPAPPPSLCLIVSAHFSTPHIHLEPNLPKVHSYLGEIASTLLAVLTQVTWWGGGGRGGRGGGNRTLYDVFKVNGTVEAMQEDILQAIRSEW